MGTAAKTVKKAEYPVYNMEKKGKLILPPKLISQLTFLHSHCGSTEWSGLLLYDVKKGNPSKPEGFELEAKHIFLMDIGSAGATDYETDGDIVDIFDEIPEAMDMKLGHVHTHHTGSAYFSAVDVSELQDNVDKHNYYLSLVLNFNGNYAAKVVFLSDMHITSKMNYTDDSGVLKHFKKATVEKHMVVIDMKIYFGEIGGFFADRLDEIVKRNDAKKKAAIKTPVGFGYGGHHNSHFHNQNMGGLPVHQQRAIGSKVIPDKMTSWEVERLTKNVLMFDAELKTESNVYAVLHQIVKSTDTELDLFYDYLLNHIDKVFDVFFDNPLDDDERIIVTKEMIMCIGKYEAIPVLTDLIENITETFDHFMLGCNPVINNAEGTINDTINEMERELE